MGETSDSLVGNCDLCGRALTENPIETNDSIFCCEGCRTIDATLPAPDNGDDSVAPDHRRDPEAGSHSRSIDGKESSATPTVTTFLQVDGMHNATCESFLEARAESRGGVVDAQASYVTEMIRIEHDPEQTSTSELCDALSTVGYTAVPRDHPTSDSRTRGNRYRAQSVSMDRGIDDLLGFRYVAGVIFGSFMLLPYVIFLYPVQLASLFQAEVFGLFTGSSGIGGSDSLLILPLFLVLTGVVLVFTGMPLLRGAYVSLKMRQPTTDLLVTLTIGSAYVYSTIVFLLGRIDVYYDLTIVIAAGVVAAIFYESLVKQRAMDRLTDLTVSQVDEAELYDGDGTTTVAVDELQPGDRVLVRQGERIPVDGVLAEGTCTVDEAVVTGESLPVRKEADDELVGGSVVTDNAATLRVGDPPTSSINQLTTAVWDLQSATHGVHRRADAVAATVIPAVIGVAVLAGVGSLVVGAGLPTAIRVPLLAVIVTCPWALGLATPLSVATSIREAMEQGIVVFDETVLERLRGMDIVVFDKTGTLTTGDMEVIDVDAPEELIDAVVQLERRASHPVSNAIVTALADGPSEHDQGERHPDGGSEDPTETQDDHVVDFQTHATGIEGRVDGRSVLVGTLDLFSQRGWSVSDKIERQVKDARGVGRLPVVVGQDGDAAGFIVVGDEPRDGWEGTLTRLGEKGIEIIVLTGDDVEAAEVFDHHPHVEHVFAGVPPDGKTAAIRRLQSQRQVTMVGDGTNDAPALAKADLGIALGSGTALASDAADLAIVTDDLTSVETAFDLARAARRRMRQNNALALLYNGITIPLALGGLLIPVFAMVAVITSSGLIGVNSMRNLINE